MAQNTTKCKELDEYLTQKITNDSNIEVTEKWITYDSHLRQYTEKMFPIECRNHHIFDKRSAKRPKTTVTIRSIEGTEYENLHDSKNLSIYAGGPGSMVGAALDSVLSNTGRPSHVMYVTYSFAHSNARSSAYYFHVRHSNAMNADSTVRGHRILKEFFRRQSLSREKLLSECRNLDYLKVDISVSGITSSIPHFMRTMSVLYGGFWHTVWNVAIEKLNPCATDWVRNRAFSQNSIPVFRYLESMGNQIGIVSKSKGLPMLLVGTEGKFSTPNAIHVVFNEKGAKHAEKENMRLFITNQIKSRQLSKTELINIMGGNKFDIYKAYLYPGDGRIAADMNLVLRDIVEKSGNTWKEGVVVESVYVDRNGVRGVELRNEITDERNYYPCSSVVLSLGYTAQYQIEKPRIENSRSLSSKIRSFVSFVKWKAGCRGLVPSVTTAVGCSGYFLVRGKIPTIETHHSHWSKVAYSSGDDVTLAKFTGGGNIGSEHFCATYAINNLEHLRKMYGDRLISILSVESCPRVINVQNDVQFYQILPGLVVCQGLGGTGMTKSGANGALSYLLSHPEVSQSDLIPEAPQLFSSVNLERFVTKHTPYTLRALGLQTDYSLLEVLFCIGICFGAIKMFPHKFQTKRHQSSNLTLCKPSSHHSQLPKPKHIQRSYHSHVKFPSQSSSCLLTAAAGAFYKLLAKYKTLSMR